MDVTLEGLRSFKGGLKDAARVGSDKYFPVILPSRIKGNYAVPAAALCFTSAGLITVLISVGGLTRLTKSGLSMVHWSPLKLSPPGTREEWEIEFERYKEFPEWQQRKSMTLDEFKYIFYWEYGHRMLGRLVGGVYGAGLAALVLTRRVPPGYHGRLFGLLALGGAQGAVGWWMVKSGLGEDRRGDRREIRVSPYRLAAHLCTAFVTYAGLVWTGFELIFPEGDRRQAASIAQKRLAKLKTSEAAKVLQGVKKFRGATMATTALTFLTVASGAFVAGNSAGNAYNDWPYMNGELIPWFDMVHDDYIGDGAIYRKLFENTAVVQFDHRILAYFTTFAVGATILSGKALNNTAAGALKLLTPQVRRATMVMGGLTIAQISLGISTLIMNVPVHLAATHQLGSLAVLTSGMYLTHSLRYLALIKVGTNAAAKTARVVAKL